MMTTSARKENKWRQKGQSENDAICARIREIEASHMPRVARTAVAAPSKSATRKQAVAWMIRNAEYAESATDLAESANAALDLPAGSMDDETHWIWEEALSVFDMFH